MMFFVHQDSVSYNQTVIQSVIPSFAATVTSDYVIPSMMKTVSSAYEMPLPCVFIIYTSILLSSCKIDKISLVSKVTKINTNWPPEVQLDGFKVQRVYHIILKRLGWIWKMAYKNVE